MKFAIKRLRHSDLTFFAAYFRKATGSKQKAINLDAAIFADLFFRRLSRLNPDRPRQVFFDLSITGPNGAPPMMLARKAILDAKNWRLNGELVNNPDEMPTRFDALAPNDLAIMAFEGDDEPIAVGLVLFAAASERDRPAFEALAPVIGDHSMVATDASHLSSTLSGLASDHPARVLIPDAEFEAALEDAAVGGIAGTARLLEIVRTRPITPKISAAALERARRRAEQIGAAGEALIAGLLEEEIVAGKIASHEWVSRANAVAPFDFTARDPAGTTTRIDAKATTGPFERRFHISGAEMVEAARGTGPYVIYRVYALTEEGRRAKLRRSTDIGSFARNVVAQAALLPFGALVDGFTIDPAALTWSPEESLD
jgi:hypothetical protein